MKSLYQYILEADEPKESDEMNLDATKDDKKENDDEKEEEEKKRTELRANVKFTIWKESKQQVDWLDNNEAYQKLEYKYINKDKQIQIHFLLGFKNGTWQLWIGKIGAVGYDDDPYYDLKKKDFKDGLLAAVDKTCDFIEEVENDPENWVQFYKNK